MSSDNGNATFYGEQRLQTLADLTGLRMSVEVHANSEKLFSYIINMCDLKDSQHSNWIIKSYIEYFSKIYDFDIFKCPFKAATYIFRPVSQIQIIALDLPSMFPVNKSGDVKTILKGKKIGNKKLEMIYETSETYMLAAV